MICSICKIKISFEQDYDIDFKSGKWVKVFKPIPEIYSTCFGDKICEYCERRFERKPILPL